MTQASDLGAIANQSRTNYRGAVNTNVQALATGSSGSSAPSPTYANMFWWDTTSGNVKIRNPANTNWDVVGTIGPPLVWTSVASANGLITSATLSGASVTTTGIPSGVVAFDLTLIAATTTAAASMAMQLGTSGGLASSGYSSTGEEIGGTVASNTSGIYLHIQTGGVSYSIVGHWRGILGASNRWTVQGEAVAANADNANTVSCGTVVLSGVLDRFAVNTTSTFTGGSASIRWFK